MTQPTAVQLRELVASFRLQSDAHEASYRRTAHTYTPDWSANGQSIAYECCADELEQLLATSEPAPEPQGGGSLIDQMVNRFLCWKLPEDFAPDAGISFHQHWPYGDPSWPTGTNLLNAVQAKEMIAHLLADVSIPENYSEAEGDAFTHGYFEGHDAALTPKPSTPQATNEREQAALYRMFRAIVDAGGPETIARHGVERGSDEWVQAVRGGLLAIEHRHHPERFDEPLYPTTPQAESVPVVGEVACKWWQQDEGYDTFSTSCGHEFTVNDCTDGNPQLPFCPYCSRRIEGIAWAPGDHPTTTPQADGEGEVNLFPEAVPSRYVREYGQDGDMWVRLHVAETALRLAASKAPAEVTCTCPSGDGSLRWPCPKHPPSGDANVDAVCSLLYARSRKGVKEYGVNTERPDFGRDDWLRELQTELLDGAVYVQAALAALRPTSTTRAGEG